MQIQITCYNTLKRKRSCVFIIHNFDFYESFFLAQIWRFWTMITIFHSAFLVTLKLNNLYIVKKKPNVYMHV